MEPRRVAILISGSGSNMVSLAQAMTGDFPARPVCVISNQPDAPGLQKARDLGIPTDVVAQKDFAGDRAAFESALNQKLAPYNVEAICLAGFMRILSPQFTKGWAGKLLNIHPSLLPKFKGLHTHSRALAAGETNHGCTVHHVTAELDAGPIIGQARLKIMPEDTAESLAARVLTLEHKLYPAALKAFLTDRGVPVLIDG